MSVYESIMAGLNEAIAYTRGEGEAKAVTRTVAPVPDYAPDEIRGIRQQLNMTQGMFAAVMGVSSKTVEAWEAGTNTPLGTARRMLSLLQHDPALPVKYHITDA